ncbi:MAG: hypothetical protein JO056_00920 [Alphaproteobacteria bacterium]|nr:hypothetical protein [Alphaproteobacteria bacterium]
MKPNVLIAGILGGIAMYIWSTLAHTVLPLGQIGISQMPHETAVLTAAQASNGEKDGLYFFPWVDPKDPQMMQKMNAAMKVNPSGLLLYHPPGHGETDMAGPLIGEFVKELAESLIAAFLLSLAALGAYLCRLGFVVLIGIAATITTNVSYFLWYGFPLDYTVANMFIEGVGYLAAGLVIAWWLGRKSVPAVAG